MSDAVETPQDGGAAHAATATPLLQLADLTMRFGGVTALSEVDLHVDEGEILGLIGPNGAGKTTVFNVVTGVFRPTSGVIRLARRGHRRPQAPRDHRPGRGPHVPEHPAVPQHDGAGERDGGRRRPPPHQRARRDAAPAPPRPGGAPGPQPGPRAARLHGHPRAGQRVREEPALRRPAPAGDRPGHGHRAAAAAARRAGRRVQPGREAPADGAHPATSGTPATRSCSSSTTWAWSWG